MGAERSHPELLDWLAVEVSRRWPIGETGSLKDLHRLIVTSSVYRQSSNHSEAAFLKDSGTGCFGK